MYNVCPGGTEDQSVTSPSGDDLRHNVYVRHYNRIRKSLQWYDLGFGVAREWKNDYVASVLYMIQDGDLNGNVNEQGII